ncbi:MAG: 50S ribosomal protein L21 [Peptococcaceae bacterium]|jgi:large subunit ribosomal protein L21|nr:50S ribosomal protein L21 [Peptococcaceae bacterium]
MYAIMESGGKQFKVQKGDVIRVEKLPADVGETVEIDRVLAVSREDGFFPGKPYVEGARVTLSVQAQGKGEKVMVFKYKPKKNFRKLRGHRQPYTELRVDEITA